MQTLALMNNERTLLIVDDEVDVCILLRRVLRKRFLKVECAHSLEQGSLLADSFHPDVILLDNNLPDGYGIENINRFKSSNKSVVVVMVSAMDIGEDALAAGADAFIGKPVDMKALEIVA